MRAGDIVDQRFAVERLAAAGGMGAVYLARDLATGAPVALKVLLGTPLHEDELRFEREALALAEVHHPGVVLPACIFKPKRALNPAASARYPAAKNCASSFRAHIVF